MFLCRPGHFARECPDGDGKGELSTNYVLFEQLLQIQRYSCIYLCSGRGFSGDFGGSRSFGAGRDRDGGDLNLHLNLEDKLSRHLRQIINSWQLISFTERLISFDFKTAFQVVEREDTGDRSATSATGYFSLVTSPLIS